MKKVLNIFGMFLTGLYLIYAIYITTLKTFPEVLAWGFMTFLAFYGWLKMYNVSEVDDE